MKDWCYLLPVIFVRWYAVRYCERQTDNYERLYVEPWYRTRFYLTPREQEADEVAAAMAEAKRMYHLKKNSG